MQVERILDVRKQTQSELWRSVFELLRKTSRTCLQKLETRFCPCPEISSLQALINEAAPQLEELSLRVPDRCVQCTCRTSFDVLPLRPSLSGC